jgi:hypothetical protein
MNESFLEYFVDVDDRFENYYLTNTWDIIFGDMEEYSISCS